MTKLHGTLTRKPGQDWKTGQSGLTENEVRALLARHSWTRDRCGRETEPDLAAVDGQYYLGPYRQPTRFLRVVLDRYMAEPEIPG